MSRTKNTLNTDTTNKIDEIENFVSDERNINFICKKTGLSRFTVTKIVKQIDTLKELEKNKNVN